MNSVADDEQPVRRVRGTVSLPVVLSVLPALLGTVIGAGVSLLATRDTIAAQQHSTVQQIEVQQRLDLRPMKRSAYETLLARADAVLYDYERRDARCLARASDPDLCRVTSVRSVDRSLYVAWQAAYDDINTFASAEGIAAARKIYALFDKDEAQEADPESYRSSVRPQLLRAICRDINPESGCAIVVS